MQAGMSEQAGQEGAPSMEWGAWRSTAVGTCGQSTQCPGAAGTRSSRTGLGTSAACLAGCLAAGPCMAHADEHPRKCTSGAYCARCSSLTWQRCTWIGCPGALMFKLLQRILALTNHSEDYKSPVTVAAVTSVWLQKHAGCGAGCTWRSTRHCPQSPGPP